MNASSIREIAQMLRPRGAATKMCDCLDIALPGKAVMVYGCCRPLVHVV